ncbi:hypothetical protein BAE44_0005834 [Dichanthelium oligosanthes]|uniref:Uncharacterized protein n=1 Tax=Dichanthelium oligosanthes TaxID=888268 RepID=A0A1E5W6W1_9POAL|nr:hypothetical protein BAE44_0005834 [Dichanthelium oligosanthes]
MFVADGATGLIETVRTPDRKLAACVHVLRTLEKGGASTADDVQEAPSARAFLDDARRELVRLRELHGTASHVFDLYHVLLGLEDEPWWQHWERHSRDTSRYACYALRGVRSATSYLMASRRALVMPRSFPHPSADWTAWMSEARSLLRLAMLASAMAMLASREMRDAVKEEVDDAWMVFFPSVV